MRQLTPEIKPEEEVDEGTNFNGSNSLITTRACLVE